MPEKRHRCPSPDRLPILKRRLLDLEDKASKQGLRFRTLPLDGHDIVSDKTSNIPKVLSHVKGPFVDDEDEDDSAEVAKNPPTRASLLDAFDDDPVIGETASPSISCENPSDLSAAPRAKTSSGRCLWIRKKKVQPPIPYEQLIANRSTTAPGKAKKSFYGIDIHDLLDEAVKEPTVSRESNLQGGENLCPSVEGFVPKAGSKRSRTLLWTEKYRARNFTDLVGDERTHRDVLRWLKGWDPVVFPNASKHKPKRKSLEGDPEPRPHRKILLLTGAPGLGKTTLAHVCARQAGYEVVEINASDERSRDVVKGRIRDCVGTENVKGVNIKEAGTTTRKAGRPVCIVVDEVDGVVSGSSGGGEGGFIKALIDLVLLDQKNSNALGPVSTNVVKSKRKGDRFRLLRPLILICNDVYHPALRPLRSSAIAEIIHIRKPPLDKVIARLRYVFDREGIACERDGVRRLCEATWGVSNKRECPAGSSGAGEGDMRGIMVVGEWVAAKMRASEMKSSRLTKRWVEDHMSENLANGGGGARGLGRGGAKEVVERVFLDGAGFPKTTTASVTEKFGTTQVGHAGGVSELAKGVTISRLREMVDSSGETDRIITDCFAGFPTQSWQDDMFLSKPNAAYEWLHFHDRISSKVHVGQEWELGSYLSQSVLGFHDLFASPAKRSWASDCNQWDDQNEEDEPLPFSGPRADYEALEALRTNRSILQGLQSSFSIPLHRAFQSAEDISTDLLPHLMQMLTPNVKPIVVGGSGDQRGIASVRKEGEKQMIEHAVNVMGVVGVRFERARVESNDRGTANFIYRMEP